MKRRRRAQVIRHPSLHICCSCLIFGTIPEWRHLMGSCAVLLLGGSRNRSRLLSCKLRSLLSRLSVVCGRDQRDRCCADCTKRPGASDVTACSVEMMVPGLFSLSFNRVMRMAKTNPVQTFFLFCVLMGTPYLRPISIACHLAPRNLVLFWKTMIETMPHPGTGGLNLVVRFAKSSWLLTFVNPFPDFPLFDDRKAIQVQLPHPRWIPSALYRWPRRYFDGHH